MAAWLGQSRVEADVRGRIQDAEAVRADQPHTARTADLEEGTLPLAARLVHLAEAGRQNDQGVDSLSPALFGDFEDRRGRNGDHRQIDGAWNRFDRWIRKHALDNRGFRVDWIDRAGESAHQQVVKHGRADAALPPRRSDDGDGRGTQDARQRIDRADLLPPLEAFERRWRQRRRKLDVHLIRTSARDHWEA